MGKEQRGENMTRNKELKKKIYGYIMQARGQHFRVSPSGNILQFGNTYNTMGKSWRLEGFTKHHFSHSPVPFKEAVKNPASIVNSIIWDVDHNTTRVWGGSYAGKQPRVQSFYPVTKRKKWSILQKGGFEW